MKEMLVQLGKRAKDAEAALRTISTDKKNQVLAAVADHLVKNSEALLKANEEVEPGYYGIPEPVSGEIVQWEDALMIMPGVAFDRQNHRVGYGGGFYDRYLEKHPRVKRVAAAFEFQLLPQVPTEPTDISPEIVVTEKQCIRG